MPARESKKKNTKNADRLRRQNAIEEAKAKLQPAKEKAKAIKAEKLPVKEAARKLWSDRQHGSKMLAGVAKDLKWETICGFTEGRSKSPKGNLDDSPISRRSEQKARIGWGKAVAHHRSYMPKPNLEDHHRKLAVVLKQVRQIKADKRLLADEEWPQYCDPYGYEWQAEADAETDAEAARRDFYCGEA
jgi:hypothetical protein